MQCTAHVFNFFQLPKIFYYYFNSFNYISLFPDSYIFILPYNISIEILIWVIKNTFIANWPQPWLHYKTDYRKFPNYIRRYWTEIGLFSWNCMTALNMDSGHLSSAIAYGQNRRITADSFKNPIYIPGKKM